MKIIDKLILALLLSHLLIACEKPEGEGGKATIKGNVWTEDWNNTFTSLETEYAAADKEVYIIYGTNTSYSKRIRTDYEGDFEFKFLREGNYKIYVYSKDKTLQSKSGEIAVVKDIEITKKKQTINLDKIVIYN
ncbi:MAG: hypothetical protein ACKVQB_01755 [Bacteroidia bacterium]